MAVDMIRNDSCSGPQPCYRQVRDFQLRVPLVAIAIPKHRVRSRCNGGGNIFTAIRIFSCISQECVSRRHETAICYKAANSDTKAVKDTNIKLRFSAASSVSGSRFRTHTPLPSLFPG